MAAPDRVAVQKNALERALSVVTDVRAGEGVTALLLAINVFLLLGLYYILKTVREALILAESGAEVKSYAAAGQAVLLLLVIPAYAALASRVNRIRLIGFVTLFFVLHLVLFAAFGAAGYREAVPFYLWLGIFNLLLVAQFWGFANDLYTEEQGKRLFPMIGVGSSLGALMGSGAAAQLFRGYSPYQLMLFSAVILLGFTALTVYINKRESNRGTEQSRAAAPLEKGGAFRMVFRNRYLRLIALLILLLNVVNTTGEFLLGKLVVMSAAGIGSEAALEAFIGSFYGNFYTWVNLLGLLIQTFLVSRIFKSIGVGGALFILPMIALTGYSFLAFYPVLAIVRVTKVIENATDYSLQNTIRSALFLPTSREAKYKAKAAIDTFFVRFGDMLQAGIVFVGSALAFSIRQYAYVTLVMVGIWLVLAWALVREHKRMAREEVVQSES